MPSSAPTVARVASVGQWTNLFHPHNGLFRLPRTEGASIEHLDIDLRFVDHETAIRSGSSTPSPNGPMSGDIYLPNVAVITLRGAEHVQDHDGRMDALADVLLAIRPIEVRWLNATNDPAEQLTFSTHLVHPTISAAGHIWSQAGGAQRLVMQGGFPCPNMSAPTPLAVTPVGTPLSSPGPSKTAFSSTLGTAMQGLSSIPSLSLTLPKSTTGDRTKDKAARKREAEYSLKPRFEWAMGSWGAENVEWRFDGRYTPACILASVERFVKALDKSFPYACSKTEARLPALLSLAPLPLSAIHPMRELVDKLELQPEVITYLVDSVFFSTSDESRHARLFEGLGPESDTAPRQTNRLKAEMLLLQIQGTTIVPLKDILGELPVSPQPSDSSHSAGSLVRAEDGETDEEGEAVTPDMMASEVFSSTAQGKSDVNELSPASSLVL